jgi:class 3 adenylate cyclase
METVRCPSCAEENPAKFRLCGYCGTPLAAVLPPSEVRKTVTILFSDLKGSTALGERLDPEALHEIKNRYFDSMAAVLERHGGRIEKYIGDAIMAVFGLPRVREDDAARAVRAAAGMQAALAELNAELERAYGVRLESRTGVNTGEVVATADPTADQRLADGDAVNVAARLEQAAPAQEVLIGQVTYELVRRQVEVESVEPLTLKGKSEPVPAYRLVAVRDADAGRDGDAAPFVGRELELAALRGTFEGAVEGRACRLVTIVGEPGVGKSRLIADFTEGLGRDATILHGRCLQYGEGITFWPIIEIVREAAAIEPDDGPDEARARIAALLAGTPDPDGIVDRVAAAVGLADAQFPVSELFWGIRKLLEAIAAERPLVLVVDDLQSAEPTLLELVEHLVDSIVGRAVLIVGSARHDLLASSPEWGQRPGMERLVLEPLSAADAARLVAAILGATGLDEAVVAQVVTAAEGNPLFVEQMVSMLVDRGHLELRDGAWVTRGGLDRCARRS